MLYLQFHRLWRTCPQTLKKHSDIKWCRQRQGNCFIKPFHNPRFQTQSPTRQRPNVKTLQQFCRSQNYPLIIVNKYLGIFNSEVLQLKVLQYRSMNLDSLTFQQGAAYPETIICPSHENAQAKTGAECPFSVHLYFNWTPKNTKSKLLHMAIFDKV